MTETTQTTAEIPDSIDEWLVTLPNRPGWGGWQSVSQSVYDGVQIWSETGDKQTAVGVWGIVTEAEPYSGNRPKVSYSVYVGDCRDPQEEGFKTAEAAMIAAECVFPELFKGQVG